jgi:two-component system response regulator FixJ
MSAAPVLLVDDDAALRDSLKVLLEGAGFAVRQFPSARMLLDDPAVREGGCVIADIRMPDMDGLQLQEELTKRRIGLPVIMMTGFGDVPLAVRALKAGAVDFIEKPFDADLMLESVARALTLSTQSRSQDSLAQSARDRAASLTGREREVLEHLVAGRSNKVIAYELDISPRTVEIHRAHVMDKMEAKSLSDLVRMAIAAGISPAQARDMPNGR